MEQELAVVPNVAPTSIAWISDFEIFIDIACLYS